MPSYDYRCLDCRKRFEVFMSYSDYGKKTITCPNCQSQNIQRKIGRIRVARSDESRIERFSGPDSLEGLEDDPRALGRMMRQMSGEVGEEMGPEFNEIVGRLEAGQSPEQIEKDLPDLGTGGDLAGANMIGGGGMAGGGMAGDDMGGEMGGFGDFDD